MSRRLVAIVLSSLLAALPAAAAGTAAVDPLPALLALAAPGAQLHVTAGVHRVNLRIDKPVTLVGEPGAILDGGGRGDVIRVAASHVTIRGLAIRHSGVDLTTENAGVFIERQVHDVAVLDNDLGDVLFGVYLDGPSAVQVIDNRIRGMTALRSPDRGDGIHLWEDSGVTIRGNDIGGTRDGIYIYISPHNRIVGNRMHDLRYGIHYMYSMHNLIADNATWNTRAGYALMQSDHLEIRGNRSTGDQDYGILLNYVTYSNFSGNQIRNVTGLDPTDGQAIAGDGGKGLFLYNSEFNRFHGNRVEHCPIGIHVTAGSESNQVYGNAFIGNQVQVKYVQNLQQEWSRHGQGNYWSDYLGWDLDGDGRGDLAYRPNDGVDVLLWKYPDARLLLDSPAILALRYVQRAFPVFMPPTVQDSHPLMHPPTQDPEVDDADRR